MVTTYNNGHKVYWDDENGLWKYLDDNESVDENYRKQCEYCKSNQTKEGHDGCLGTLIGINYACCGHGRESDCYIQFLDGSVIRGKDAKIVMEVLKKYTRQGVETVLRSK